jgi:hypothetical protein
MSKADRTDADKGRVVSDHTVIDWFLAGISGAQIPAEVFCDEVVLDATVPNWRYQVRGAPAVAAELAKWYAEPGRFSDVRRTDIPNGELVQFTLTWTEHEVEHRCHQAHVLQLRNSQVLQDTVWCGGRWPADLIAEMQAAAT